MGHLVNSNAFRLGQYKKWKNSWINEGQLYLIYLHNDFLIFKFLKNYFLFYGNPFFSTMFLRNTKIAKSNISGLANLIKNQFNAVGFIFSHVNIKRGFYLGIDSFLWDTLLEKWRQSIIGYKIRLSSLFFAPRPSPRKKPIFFSIFKSTRKFRRFQNSLNRNHHLKPLKEHIKRHYQKLSKLTNVTRFTKKTWVKKQKQETCMT
jgi:hypothetical protein